MNEFEERCVNFTEQLGTSFNFNTFTLQILQTIFSFYENMKLKSIKFKTPLMNFEGKINGIDNETNKPVLQCILFLFYSLLELLFYMSLK